MGGRYSQLPPGLEYLPPIHGNGPNRQHKYGICLLSGLVKVQTYLYLPPGSDNLSLDESVGGLNLNVAVGPVSYSNDALWRAHGPQTLQQACSFVRRVFW